MNRDELTHQRRDYSVGVLSEGDLPKDPLNLFAGWLQLAFDRKIPDANAMFLATIDQEGYPSGRIVLLRDATPEGLSFFTNYNSSKAGELARQPKASLGFFWSALERQVRIRGTIHKLTSDQSDAYFATRPRDSQIGAWASPQSEVIPDRDTLERAVAKYTAQFADQTIPRPPHWGGYQLVVETWEFWQGRPNRLHDRIRARISQGTWKWERLAP